MTTDRYTTELLHRLRVNAALYERRNKALGLAELLRDAADSLEAWCERAETALVSVERAIVTDEPAPEFKEKPKPRARRQADIYIVERRPAPPANEYERNLKRLLDLVRAINRGET